MEGYIVSDVVFKLIGKVTPIGETNEDDKRYDNLVELNIVVVDLVEKLNYTAEYANEVEYSVSRIGEYASKKLTLLRQYLESNGY